MKRFIPILFLFPFLLGACGALGQPVVETTPTISVEDVRATANAMVYDMLTQTQAAMPTNTLVPPTNTMVPPTNTPLPTATEIVATESADGAPTPVVAEASPTAVVAALPTSTQASAPGEYACTKQPLQVWTGDSAKMSVTNTVSGTTAYVFLCITTPYGEAGYITIPAGSSALVPVGSYFATAWVSGKKDFNVSLGFTVKDTAGQQLIIETNKLRIASGCTPDC